MGVVSPVAVAPALEAFSRVHEPDDHIGVSLGKADGAGAIVSAPTISLAFGLSPTTLSQAAYSAAGTYPVLRSMIFPSGEKMIVRGIESERAICLPLRRRDQLVLCVAVTRKRLSPLSG
jgi:hypothetical protein